MKWLADALAHASEGRQKAIALEAFPDMSPEAAQAELSKYLGGARGDAAFRVVEAVARFGARDRLRAALERELRDIRPGELVDRVEGLHAQLELFGAAVMKLSRDVRDAAEVLPLRRKDGGG